MLNIYYNAKIYTAEASEQFAEAFAINNGTIEAVGTSQELLDSYSTVKNANLIDLQGACVLPGFVESHAHLIGKNTFGEDNIIMIDPKTLPEELGDVLRPYITDVTDGIIKAMGFELKISNNWSAALIDEVCPHIPVFIFSCDGHAMLMNTKAIELAGIDKNTKDPGETSYFVRDLEGNPTGLVIEVEALSMCRDALSSDFKPEEIKSKIVDEIAIYNSFGYTMGFDAATIMDGDPTLLTLLKEMENEGQLNMNLYLSFSYNRDDDYLENAHDLMTYLAQLREEFSSELLHPTNVKFILDGTIENKTACLYDPYCIDDETFNGGELLIPAKEFSYVAKLAADNDFSIHVHAIGDRAICEAIDGLTPLKKMKGTRTIAHNQLYNDADLHIFKANSDIFYNTTPCWVEEDEYTLNVLGQERYQKQFPTGSVLRNGVTITFGSDSLDGEKAVNPFWGMYYAMNRGKKNTALGVDIVGPIDESISLTDAINAYTINGATQLMAENYTGSIAVGKNADFIILNQDIFACPKENIPQTKIEKTFLKGKCVFDRKRR